MWKRIENKIEKWNGKASLNCGELMSILGPVTSRDDALSL